MRTIDHWIGGKPTTGRVHPARRRCGTRRPASSRPRSLLGQPARRRRRGAGRQRRRSTTWRESSLSPAHAVLFAFRELVERAHRRDRRDRSPPSTARCSPTPRARCSAASRSSSSPAASRTLLKGEYSDQVSTGVDVFSFRQPLGVVAGHHAVQLPGDGADVDVPGRDRLRQHVRAQAERARPVGRRMLRRRAVRRGRPARRRVQRRARRQGGRRRAARPPGRRRGLVRRLDPDRQYIHERGHRQRQARAGARRREEPRDRPARRRPRLRRRPPRSRPAFGSAGERCMAISAVVAVGGAGDALVDAGQREARRAVRVGPGRDAGQRDGPGRHRARPATGSSG